MTRDDAHAALQGVADAMNDQHDDEQGRLTQLAYFISSARMAVDHLFDHAENTAASKEG